MASGGVRVRRFVLVHHMVHVRVGARGRVFAKGFVLHVAEVKARDRGVVEFQPRLLPSLSPVLQVEGGVLLSVNVDVGQVVPRLGNSHVNDHASQLVFELLWLEGQELLHESLLLFLFLLPLLLRLLRVFLRLLLLPLFAFLWLAHLCFLPLHLLILVVQSVVVLLLVFLPVRTGFRFLLSRAALLPLECLDLRFAVQDDLLQHELLHVELLRELELVVELHVSHGVQVEEMRCRWTIRVFWKSLDGEFLLDGHPLRAGATRVPFNDLAGNHALEGLVDRLLVLDLDRKGVEIFIGLHYVAALLANCQRRDLALEGALAQILLRSVLKKFLKAIKAEIDEFLGVLLHSNVGRVATWFFKCEAEVDWGVFLPVCHCQEGEQPDHLMEQVVVELLAILVLNGVKRCSVVSSEQGVSEGRHVEQLLEH